MRDNMLQVIRDIKSFFNLSLAAIIFFGIASYLAWLAPGVFETPTWSKFGKIYEEYFSMLYGILFGLFVLVLCARLHLLGIIIRRMAHEKPLADFSELQYFR